MTIRAISNKPGTAATVHVNATGSIVIPGNSSVSTIACGAEVLTGAAITQLFWGCDAGSIQIARNGNTVGVYTGSGHLDYAGAGLSLTVNQTSNVDISFVGTSNGYVLIELQKIGNNLTANSSYFQV